MLLEEVNLVLQRNYRKFLINIITSVKNLKK